MSVCVCVFIIYSTITPITTLYTNACIAWLKVDELQIFKRSIYRRLLQFFLFQFAYA